MGGYLLNFIVYTIAMIGLIFLALFVYKKCAIDAQISSKNKFLKVEDSINLAPRKQMFIIRAGNEKFLVASDAERTTLISKLGDSKQAEVHKIPEPIVDEIPRIHHFQDNKNEKSAIRNFAKRLDL
ncbi:MAG: flagellar biosynthetic protein FliO [Clostridiaceae bacterium]|jgi:flagellar biogenesis protein FliO|nr:flagellar biosynthetic protein FliO [Clostridiaceae bacterium]